MPRKNRRMDADDAARMRMRRRGVLDLAVLFDEDEHLIRQ